MTHPDTKPEALRLADTAGSAQTLEYGRTDDWIEAAAAELRRLHAECESLRTKLQEQALQSLSTMGQDDATIADLRTQLAEAQRLAAARLEQMTADRAQALRWRDEAEALRKAAGQASFCLRELLPNDPDAQMTVRMLDTAMGAKEA